jgi:cytoskeletal protein CcmA (bactofilin family)
LSGLNSVSSLSINGGTVNSTGDLNVTGNISVTGTVTGATEVSSTISKADNGVFTNLSSTSNFNVTGSTTLGNVTGTNINCTNLSATNDLSAGGNIEVVGTVDGIDIATANTKLNNHVASATVHYVQTDIDHGNLQGLLEDDHTQYILSAGTRSIDHLTVDNDLYVVGDITVTGTVDGIDLPARDTVLTNHVASATVHYPQGDIDHDVLQNLTTGNPHTQYVLKSGSVPFTGDATFDAGVNVSGNIEVSGTVDGVDVAARDTVLTNHIASSVHQLFTTTTEGIVPECDSSETYRFLHAAGDWTTPFPYSYVQMDGAGVDSAAIYWFASGVTPTLVEKDTDQIEWDDTNKYFTVKETGTYEMIFCGAASVGGSPTEINMSVAKVAPPASDFVYLEKVQTIRTNMDPHDLNLRWIGNITATTNYTLRINGTNACQLKQGSTLTLRRIG